MENLLQLLTREFNESINVSYLDMDGNIYIWISIVSVPHREIQLNLSRSRDTPKDKHAICLSLWNPKGDSLEDLSLVDPIESSVLGGLFPCGPLTLKETKDHYAILDGNEECIYMSDSHMKDILPWLNPRVYDTDIFSLDQWLLVKDIPYDEEYSFLILKGPTYLWNDYSTESLISIPVLTEQQKELIPLLKRDDINLILPRIEHLISDDFHIIDIDPFCTLGVKDDRIIFSLKEYGNIIDLSIHPIFSRIPSHDVITYIKRFRTCEDIYPEFLSLENNFRDLRKRVKSNTFEIDTKYAVSRLQAGYPYYLHVQPVYTKQIGSYSYVEHPFENTNEDTIFDDHVREILLKNQIPYTQVKHRVHVQWHGDAIFDMEIPEDIPQSLLHKGRIIEEDDGGCCSQRHCGGYILEFNVLVRGTSLLKL